jgi:hypothetical protein
MENEAKEREIPFLLQWRMKPRKEKGFSKMQVISTGFLINRKFG